MVGPESNYETNVKREIKNKHSQVPDIDNFRDRIG